MPQGTSLTLRRALGKGVSISNLGACGDNNFLYVPLHEADLGM